MTEVRLEPALSIPSGFRFGEVSSLTTVRAACSTVPPLGPLAAFTGTFRGNGFNSSFRPDNSTTPTKLPVPVSGSDNVLELNLTQETLSFSPSLGSVPNRGEVQGDIFLNGVPYLQTITDVTVPSQPIGIHFEPRLWMHVPQTKDPAEGTTLVRMASIEIQDPISEPDRHQRENGADPAGPEPVRQGRDHHPEDPDRPDHAAAESHRVADHHVDDGDHHLDQAGRPAVRRRHGQHRVSARGPEGHRAERAGAEHGGGVLDRDGRIQY